MTEIFGTSARPPPCPTRRQELSQRSGISGPIPSHDIYEIGTQTPSSFSARSRLGARSRTPTRIAFFSVHTGAPAGGGEIPRNKKNCCRKMV